MSSDCFCCDNWLEVILSYYNDDPDAHVDISVADKKKAEWYLWNDDTEFTEQLIAFDASNPLTTNYYFDKRKTPAPIKIFWDEIKFLPPGAPVHSSFSEVFEAGDNIGSTHTINTVAGELGSILITKITAPLIV